MITVQKEKMAVTLLLVVGIILSIFWFLPRGSLPEDADLDSFSAARAMQHLSSIARAPHSMGSSQQAAVRDYIIQQLEALGLDPEIQQAIGFLPIVLQDESAAGMIENIVARMEGTDSSGALLILAHYDSVPIAPAAADNGTGASVLLELARLLSTRESLQNDVILLFDDGEEYGFLGSQAFVDQHPWASEVKLAVSLDTAVAGPMLVNQTGSLNGWLMRGFARANPRSISSSLAARTDSSRLNGGTYDILPFLESGIQGLALEDNYAFPQQHTSLDQIEIVNPASLQQMGDQITAFAQHFGNIDLSYPIAQEVTFFSVPVIGMLVYSITWARVFSILCALIFLGAVFLGLRRRLLTWRGLLLGGLIMLGALIVILVLSQLLWKLDRALHPWTNPNVGEVHPYNSLIYFVGFIFLGIGFFSLLQWWERSRFSLSDRAVSGLFVPFLGMCYFALDQPGIAYIFTWPLLATSLAWIWIFLRRPSLEHVSNWGFLLLAALVSVFMFVPAVLFSYEGGAWEDLTGWMLILILLLFFLIPQIDALMKPKAWIFPALASAIAVVFIAFGVITSSRYDDLHPWLNNLRYEYNLDTGNAAWVSDSTHQDPWLAQIFPPGEFKTDAPATDLNASEIKILQNQFIDGIHSVQIQATAPDGVIKQTFGVKSTANVKALSIEGKMLRLAQSADGEWRFINLYAPPPEGYVLTLQLIGNDPVTIGLENSLLGLPQGLSVPARPDHMSTFGDSTLIHQEFVLESAQ
jgi:hypothetical protein